MLKTLGALVVGLTAGLIVAMLFLRDSDVRAPVLDTSSPAVSDGSSDEQLEELRADMELRFAMLDQRLVEMTGNLVGLGEEIEAIRAAASAGAALSSRPSEMALEEMSRRSEALREMYGRLSEQMESIRNGTSQRDTERLLAAGFTQERIDWIDRRSDELRMEAVQAQYEAQRGGTRAIVPSLLVPAIALRSEMGDAEYERYLSALGRPTTVDVRQLLASSPAEKAGLQVGDEIVAYDGKRVASLAELNALSLEDKPGQSVVVEVKRDGQSMQFVLPRGPVGVTGGFLPPVR